MHKVKTAVLVISIMFLVLFTANNCFSEIYYTSDVLIGEKAIGLGGAFSAIADSPEACFYNPAGLVLATVPYLSVSAQVAEYSEQKGKFLFSKNEKFYSQELVPSFWGISRDLGPGRIGFSIAVPYYYAYELHQRYDNKKINPFDSATIIKDKKTMDKTYLIGPSYGYKINPDLFIGSTIYFNYKVFKEQNNTYINGYGKGFSAFNKAVNENDGSGIGISSIFGLLFKYSEKLNLSTVFKSGDFATNNVNYKSDTFQYTEIGDSTSFVPVPPVDKTIKNKFQMPPSTTFGLAYRLNTKVFFSYDISYFFPVAYNIDYIKYNSSSKEFETLTKRIQKRNIFNHNVGGEYMITENIPLRLGFYTNYSLAPEIDINNVEEKSTHIDKYGISLSSGMISENSTLMINLKYGFGKGEMASYNFDKKGYEKQDLIFSSYGIGLSGSYWF
ncbi:MAG: outer membrane protein transport protein [Candidatus Firestonebacteria bacterium]|nr:outer membrane protein transport protein [Candidatus Firestonebacteria bacterium]